MLDQTVRVPRTVWVFVCGSWVRKYFVFRCSFAQPPKLDLRTSPQQLEQLFRML